MQMRGTGIDSDVEIYATKQSNEHQYMELKRGGGGYRYMLSRKFVYPLHMPLSLALRPYS
jgi:hypothetical protein